MKKALETIQKALDSGEINWKQLPSPGSGSNAFQGFSKGGKVTFLVVAFDIEPQGFPAGFMGYDGTATIHEPVTVVHLTRELAEQAFKQAEEKTR